MLLKIIQYYSIVGVFILTFVEISCNNYSNKRIDNLTNSEQTIESCLSKGQLSELFNETDTLNFSINLSGCIDRRIDIVSFFKKQDTIYIKSKIRFKLDSDSIIIGKTKKYNLTNDTLNFESLLTKTQEKMQGNADFKVLISIGVLNKWEVNYIFDRDSDDFIKLKNRYLNIMDKIYPEIDEYEVFDKLEIIDEI